MTEETKEAEINWAELRPQLIRIGLEIGPLLVFRFVYFLVPLALGSLVFLTTELIYRRRGRSAADKGDAKAKTTEA